VQASRLHDRWDGLSARACSRDGRTTTKPDSAETVTHPAGNHGGQPVTPPQLGGRPTRLVHPEASDRDNGPAASVSDAPSSLRSPQLPMLNSQLSILGSPCLRVNNPGQSWLTVRHWGTAWRKSWPYGRVLMRLSRTTTRPRSVRLRISRPKPCLNLSTASGIW